MKMNIVKCMKFKCKHNNGSCQLAYDLMDQRWNEYKNKHQMLMGTQEYDVMCREVLSNVPEACPYILELVFEEGRELTREEIIAYSKVMRDED